MAAHVEHAEPPELLARNIYIGSRIWAAAQAFFFVAFLFAFFYLRALNSNGIWRGWPGHHPTPSMAFGASILACVVASAAVLRLTLGLSGGAWVGAAVVSLGLGLAAVALQCAQFTSLGFGPTDGGYTSVFVGWTGLFAVAALGAMIWLETLIAQSLRLRASSHLEASTEGLSFVLSVLAGVEVVAFVLLYLVA